MNEEELVAFTREFSEQYDFAIKPLEFIQSFSNNGLLHFDHGRIEISLPFIKSYLVASELAENPQKAITYFAMDSDDFDIQTFDLYAEIGVSEDLVENAIAHLETSICELSDYSGDQPFILSNKIRPGMLRKIQRVQAIQERLKTAAQEVREDREDKTEKQRILDIADNIKRRIARETHKSTTKKSGPNAEQQDTLERAGRAWAIGTVLLGSGAEHLQATTKRRLARSIVQLSAHMIDGWTQLIAAVDFDDLRKKLSNESSVDDFLKAEGTSADISREDALKLIEGVVDILEFTILATPMRRTLDILCEQARHSVLASSVAGVQTSEPLESLVKGIWLAEISQKIETKPLLDAVRELPQTPFIRIALATHFMTRVHWNHWEKRRRLGLLDAADTLLRTLKGTPLIDKSKVKRLIQRDDHTPTDDEKK